MGAIPFFFFFFQAEDGIRDYKVTGVQTCALPILPLHLFRSIEEQRGNAVPQQDEVTVWFMPLPFFVDTGFDFTRCADLLHHDDFGRSEERRVGKECRCRWWARQ